MRWKVEAADPVTGSDQVLTLEALTAEEAERQARYNGLLVSNVSLATPRRPDTPVLVYESPAAHRRPEGVEAAGGPHLAVPNYPRIVNAARWLLRISRVMFALALAAVICSGGALAVYLRRALDNALADDPVYLVRAGQLFAAAAILAVFGVLLRLVGAVAFAVRDIARNSFRPTGVGRVPPAPEDCGQ